jgi:hypothetical protein
MSKFYNNFKDSIKDEISHIDRLKNLAEMIEIMIRINN